MMTYLQPILSGTIHWQLSSRSVLPLLASGLLFSAAWIAAAVAISVGTDTPLSHLTRDAAAIFDFSFYYGLISTVGIMLWASTSAVCSIGTAILWDRQRRMAFMLLAAGVLSLMMTLDDAFMFHEYIFPELFGIPEKVVMLCYILYMAGYLYYFRQEIYQTDFLVLGLAFVAFGTSSLMDFALAVTPLNTFLEDGLKFTGIVLWLIYFSSVTVTRTRHLLKPA